jgi:hypothetical protein
VEAGTEQTCLINPPIKKFLLPGYVWRVFREDGWVWRAISLRLPSHRSSPSRSGDFDSELTLVKKCIRTVSSRRLLFQLPQSLFEFFSGPVSGITLGGRLRRRPTVGDWK